MKAETSSSSPRRGAALQQLKLHDCLIEVSRTEVDDTKSALFSLGCYLTVTTGIPQDGTLDCQMLSYSKFEADLRCHFNYDPERDEIRWENESSFQPATEEAGSATVFVVKSHNSWVTALRAMQSARQRQASMDSHSIPAALSPAMTARFSIVHADYDSAHDPDYTDSARSDHSTTSEENDEGDEGDDDEDSHSEESEKEESDY